MDKIEFLNKQLDLLEGFLIKTIRQPRLREQHDKESLKTAYKYWRDMGAPPTEAAAHRFRSPKAVLRRHENYGTPEIRANPPTAAQAYGLKPKVFREAQIRIGEKLGETAGPKQLKEIEKI